MCKIVDTIPHGNYTFVGLDVDTTGRRLIDEIVHIAAYTPNDTFSQHIMPLMNLNPAARQRHQLRVITVGFFRMLKSMLTYKVIKTKTEITTLNEFLTWLEKQNTKDGIIFIYHDQRKFVPYIMIEAFKKYNLLDRFLKITKSFVNGYDLAEEKCANTIKYISLNQLFKILSVKSKETKEIKDSTDETTETKEKTSNGTEEANDEENAGIERFASNQSIDDFEGNASVRAKMTYEITEHLAREQQEEGEVCDITELMNSYICKKAKPSSSELHHLKEQEDCLVRQNSLRNVFLQYFRSTLYHRVRAVTYRRLLAEANYDNDSLEELWKTGKIEGITEAVNKIETITKEEERTELIEILDAHYDPEKKCIQPVVKRSTSNRRRGSSKNRNGNPSQNQNSHNGNQNGNGQQRSRNKESRQRRRTRAMDNYVNDGNPMHAMNQLNQNYGSPMNYNDVNQRSGRRGSQNQNQNQNQNGAANNGGRFFSNNGPMSKGAIKKHYNQISHQMHHTNNVA